MATNFRTLSILAVGLGLGTIVARADFTPRFVNSRHVALCYRTADAAVVDAVHVWVSTDSGRTWQSQDEVQVFDDRVLCAVERDGRYDFYLVLENAAGVSAPPPVAGTRPHSSVVVDTTPPLLQIHSSKLDTDDEGLTLLSLRTSLIEEHQSRRGCRLFYRGDPTGLWCDGGEVCVSDDLAEWPVPKLDADRIEVKLVATDQAGNRAVSAAFAVELPRPAKPEPAKPEPTEPQREVALAASETSMAPSALPPAPAEPTKEDLTRVAGLREAALRYLREGRLGLAEARLRDALERAPQQTDLLIDLGTVLYHAKRYDDAGSWYQRASGLEPNHLGAIEGLAVVAATQRRYPEARQHLERLLTKQPDSGLTWLRMGDVEHKLGRADAAVEAWRRAANASDSSRDVRSRAEVRLQRFGAPAALKLSSAAR